MVYDQSTQNKVKGFKKGKGKFLERLRDRRPEIATQFTCLKWWRVSSSKLSLAPMNGAREAFRGIVAPWGTLHVAMTSPNYTQSSKTRDLGFVTPSVMI